MRRKILLVALTAVALAIVVLGIPAALLLSRNVVTAERTELERLALRAAVEITPRDVPTGSVRLPTSAESDPVGLYDASGRRLEGNGPPRLDAALSASLHGRVGQYTSASALVVGVPLTESGHVFGVVRAASPLSDIDGQVHRDWLVLAGIAVGAAALAGLIATVQSRRLAAPLTTLQRVATELGEGNLGARAPRSGVAEIDRAGEALNATASRLGALIAREQSFSASASHQLRTPLTALRLQLEAGLAGDPADLEAAARGAIRSADDLERTVNDVLSLARLSRPQGPAICVADLLDDVRRRWAAVLARDGRDLRVDVAEAPTTTTPTAALRQVLDVLVDNAYRHGEGTVTLSARAIAGALALDVADQGRAGPLLPPPERGGLGLSMAVSIAGGQGGRLVQGPYDEPTRMTVLVPGEPD